MIINRKVVGGGGGDCAEQYMTSVGGWSNAICPENMTINALNATNVGVSNNYAFAYIQCKNLTIKSNNNLLLTGYCFYSMSRKSTGVKKLTLDCPSVYVTYAEQVLRDCTYLEEIISPPIDFSQTTAGLPRFLQSCSSLTTVSFKENTLGFNPDAMFLEDLASLNNASLVSIANSLNESVSYAIEFHATPKARLSTIMGTVAMDSGNTYHIFTADESGTTSLQSFITDVKGWSIA